MIRLPTNEISPKKSKHTLKPWAHDGCQTWSTIDKNGGTGKTTFLDIGSTSWSETSVKRNTAAFWNDWEMQKKKRKKPDEENSVEWELEVSERGNRHSTTIKHNCSVLD